MNVPGGNAPQQPLRFESLGLDRSVRQDVERIHRQDIEVWAAQFQVIRPRMRWEAKQFDSRLVAPFVVWVVAKDRFATADKQPAESIAADRQE